MEFMKINPDDLRPLIAEAQGENTEETFVQDYVNAVTRILEGDPARYRSYGVYWWLLKRELIRAGFTQFGEELNEQWIEKLDYGNAALNVTAAYSYSQAIWGQSSIYSNQHVMETTDGEVITASVEDAEIEAVLVAKRLVI